MVSEQSGIKNIMNTSKDIYCCLYKAYIICFNFHLISYKIEVRKLINFTYFIVGLLNLYIKKCILLCFKSIIYCITENFVYIHIYETLYIRVLFNCPFYFKSEDLNLVQKYIKNLKVNTQFTSKNIFKITYKPLK